MQADHIFSLDILKSKIINIILEYVYLSFFNVDIFY